MYFSLDRAIVVCDFPALVGVDDGPGEHVVDHGSGEVPGGRGD